ncbi:MAG: hypothetical protein K9H48_10140 [Melioribacteraceae bacterium]|nr:hypothetical protein [Melioribacteraceae bacterium]MCF8393305.1 hypothetical protein [Melioribacteraceae bacterium]MCF8419157.1 hypothetical protein [Melioribacteraceae bacterium]
MKTLTDKNILSQKFIDYLTGTTDGFLSANEIAALIDLFEKEAAKHYFTESSENNLIRIIAASYDRPSFLSECIDFPHHAEIIISVAVNSNYLTDIIVRNPEYLYQMFNQEYLSEEISIDSVQSALHEGIMKYKSFDARINYVRMYKRRQLLKIGLNDILNKSDLIRTTIELSYLAKGICKIVFELCGDVIANKYNVKLSNERYSLCALGKLGGDELNYSSDIDLIIFYDRNSNVENTNKEYFELLTETVQLFISVLTEVSDRGFLYRADFRLRPDGQYSPLCRTLSDYLKYYETRGEDWERQMLIKLSFISGSNELYRKFRSLILPFVYPSAFSKSPLQQIKKMKSNIEARIKDEENIKLFAGGIRDIEFSVQALQLLDGAAIKELQTGNTLQAIELLRANKLLNQNEYEIYKSAYIFYRKTEHYLQLMNDTQTHVIPIEGELTGKISSYMGFNDQDEFSMKIKEYRLSVKSIFNDILSIEDDGSASISGFESIEFRDRNKGKKNLEYLKSGKGLFDVKEFDSRTIDLFQKIERSITNYLLSADDPDLILENFCKVIRSVSFPSIWYREFQNRKLLEDFLFLCEYSQKTINLICLSKIQTELFISGKVFVKNIDALYDNISIDSLLLILSVQYYLKLISADKLSHHLSNYINNILTAEAEKIHTPCKFFIAGMGSFGTKEMGFASDVDLVVVAENIMSDPGIQNKFQKYLSELKKMLKHFDVDFRLRPEGKSSPLVWDISSYKNYLVKRAQVWEFQSLLKLNFVYGDTNLFEQFRKDILEGVSKFKRENIISQIQDMNRKLSSSDTSALTQVINLKRGFGTITTIEFILELLILPDRILYEKCISKNISQKIEILMNLKPFPEIEQLNNTYNFYKNLELVIQITFDANNYKVPNDSYKKMKIVKQLGLADSNQLNELINSHIKLTSSLYRKFIG